MEKLLAQVERTFGDLANRYKLSIVKLRSSEIALRGKKFAIVIFIDCDAVSVCYIKAEEKGAKKFPLGHFLVTKQLWTASNQPVRVSEELESYALNLKNSGQHILMGDESWMKVLFLLL